LPTRHINRLVRLTLILLSFALGSLLGPGPAWAASNFDPQKFAAIAVDAGSGEVLFERMADARRFPASLTKVMTIYLAYDAIAKGDLKLTDKVVMSPHAASRPPSKLGLPAGRSLTVKQALDVLVVKSANDVAVALGERIAGSEAEFAKRMTARAKALGMKQTRFRNASGLPDARQVTTARDLAILALAFLRDHPKGYRLFDQERTSFRGHVIMGHNRLLAKPGIDGFKTGYTYASGFNLLTSGVRDGHRIIAVVLGGPTALARDRFMTELIGASFAALTIRKAGTDLTVASLLGPKTPSREGPQSKNGYIRIRASAPSLHAEVAQGDDEGSNVARASKWAVQVGAYSTAARGRKRIAQLASRYPKHFDAENGYLDKIGSAYQVRFTRASAAKAKTTCSILEADDGECLVLQTDD